MSTVSILIPNYNHAKHLHQSLGGACGQTRPADEILVCDDGSKDNSVEVISEFAAKYPQLRLLRNDPNRGMQYTINRLLHESTGDYIVCAAADDELYPKFLERHMERLAKYPDVGMSVSE
ncbi:MAG TPA: glycosyltransferase family A protein, partial [Hyphomicrobiaceae bacterium]|nr:glycosyltransferase family A protein [Hyphomicrobiaceae bacterium]